MAHKDKTQIDKFDGQDFHPWQVYVKYKLMSKGLWPCATSTRVIDLKNTKDVEDDERAQAIIMLHLDKSLIHHVDELKTCRLKWSKQLYGATRINSKMSLKISLYGLEYNLDVEKLGAFISHMKGIMSQ